ncbi:MAG: hypothetical protein K1X44_07840 [Alphaproteobacteria bacterium]|nr:hypothetical protein [Alphaproteobacteria bacterium]
MSIFSSTSSNTKGDDTNNRNNYNNDTIDGEELRDLAQKAGRQVKNFIHDKSEQAAELKDKAKDKITTHPFEAIGIAALGGLILGFLLKR